MLHFGTDGVRGRVGVDLTESDVASLGRTVSEQWPGHQIVIGHDGRESGDVFSAAFAAGAASAGGAITFAGLASTPALAYASQRRNQVAVAVTASHNPWSDNGIKVFAPGGRKLTHDEQQHIETRWHSQPVPASSNRAFEALTIDPSVVDDYIRRIAGDLEVANFAGREVVVDCANGATSRIAAPVMRALGLQADVRNATPDGRNINDGCGAVHPEALGAVCAERGVVGVAFDGDGDRLIAIAENGTVVDGDRIIALLALDLHERGLLARNVVVVTTMTNLGFHHAMQRNRITVVTTEVGDRAVLAAMEDGGFTLGGEQSGHIINMRYATTGDGMLTAVLLLDLLRRKNVRLTDLAADVLQRVPQLLRNVRVADKPLDVEALLGDDLIRERANLGDRGRIVVRTSGTESVVRIMVEATDIDEARAVADRLERVLATHT